MRIGFLGKGGSGKTTMTAAFITYLQSKTDHILAIDADHNVHLKNTVGLRGEVLPLGENYQKVAQYLEGNRDVFKGMKEIPTVGTIPPSLKQSKFIRPHKNDKFLQKFALQTKGLSLLEVGTIKEKDAGNDCYHSKLNSLEVIFHHLLDKEDEFVVADATAGLDNLGTSLFFVYDLNIFVVEPTQKSISVFLQYEEVCMRFNIPLFVIVNKVVDEEDKEFVKKHIDVNKIIGFLPYSKHIKRLEQGDSEGLKNFVLEQEALFEKIYSLSTKTKRDWKGYYEKLRRIYEAECKDWWNDYYSSDLHLIHDPAFSYEKVV